MRGKRMKWRRRVKMEEREMSRKKINGERIRVERESIWKLEEIKIMGMKKNWKNKSECRKDVKRR